jgi:hypothetical protein
MSPRYRVYTVLDQIVPDERVILSYVRVSITGTLPGGEVWSVNPVFDPTGEIGGVVSQTALETAAGLIANRSLPASLLTSLSSAVSRTGAKVEVRDDATDNLIGLAQVQSTTAQVGLTGIKCPPQSAVVLSIRTNTPGGSGRGRLYWPGLGVTLDNSGRFTTPATATFASDFKAYLIGIRADLASAFTGIGFDLAVRSKTTHTTPHATRIQIGNVVDTQRRRRDALPEAYSSVVFP